MVKRRVFLGMPISWFHYSLLLIFFLITGCHSFSKSVNSSGFTVTETNGLVQVDWNGKLLSAYHFRDVSRPFVYPLLGPDDVHLTRRWPQETVLNEEHDHPHHHALWWAHGDVNGDDFWSESPKAGRTVHQHFTQQTGGRRAVIAARNKWINKVGNVVAEDERRLIFYPPTADLRTMDFEITVFAGKQDLVLGDTKEGTMAIRLAETMRLVRGDKSLGQGQIFDAAGDRNQATWGKRAAWCDYSGPVESGIYGVTMIDHPTNPRYPTWWHVRDYGLFAANPFGVHDFEKKAKGTGDLRIKAGELITFRYRLLLHKGELKSVNIENFHMAFAAEKRVP